MSDEVADVLQQMIIDNRLAAGQKITQDELAKMLNVSTMPVREALLKLAAIGLVDAAPNRSFRVVNSTKEDARDSLLGSLDAGGRADAPGMPGPGRRGCPRVAALPYGLLGVCGQRRRRRSRGRLPCVLPRYQHRRAVTETAVHAAHRPGGSCPSGGTRTSKTGSRCPRQRT